MSLAPASVASVAPVTRLALFAPFRFDVMARTAHNRMTVVINNRNFTSWPDGFMPKEAVNALAF